MLYVLYHNLYENKVISTELSPTTLIRIGMEQIIDAETDSRVEVFQESLRLKQTQDL